MRILLIEDEALIALDAEACLISAGHEVLGPYKTHDAALAAARRDRPDIAMVDINLAGANEGIAIVRDLWDLTGVRSIFATGQPDIARDNRAFALGVLAKPYSPPDLINTFPVLQSLIDGGSPPPPAVPAGFEIFR